MVSHLNKTQIIEQRVTVFIATQNYFFLIIKHFYITKYQ